MRYDLLKIYLKDLKLGLPMNAMCKECQWLMTLILPFLPDIYYQLNFSICLVVPSSRLKDQFDDSKGLKHEHGPFGVTSLLLVWWARRQIKRIHCTTGRPHNSSMLFAYVLLYMVVSEAVLLNYVSIYVYPETAALITDD